MRDSLSWLWRHHRILVLICALGAAASLFFAVRLVVFWLYWANPDHHRAPLEGWMTIGYVARSWKVPPEVLLDLAAPGQRGGRPLTLADIAAAGGEPLSALIDRLESALPPPP
jgi:hypothetical protein